MICNDYVKEITTELDLEYFKRAGLENITKEWLRTPAPIALGKFTATRVIMVDEVPYLRELRQRFPKLRAYMEMMKFEPGVIPIHTDNKRSCALNIPIFNCNEQTTTTFYEATAVDQSFERFGDVPPRLWKSSEFISYYKDAKPVFSFQFNRPVLFNTSKPHGIVNNSNNVRLAWTWTCDDSFENMKKAVP